MIVSQAADLIVPLFTGKVIDAIVRDDMSAVWTGCIIMLLVTVASAIAAYFRAISFQTMSERISRNLSNDVFSSIVHKDVSFFDEKKTGEFLSRLSSDITIIKNGLGVNIALFIRTLVLLFLMLVLLFVLSWKLTLIMVASLIPVILAINVYSAREKKYVKQAQEKKADASVIAEECFSNSRTVKAFAMEEKEQSKYQKQNILIYLIGFKRAVLYGGFSFFLTIFMYGAMVVIIWYGAKLNQDGELSVGTITSYLFYCIQILVNFSIFTSLIATLMQVSGAASKIIEFIDHIPLINSRAGIEPENESGEVELRNVSFSYPSKPDVQILKDVSFTAKKNQVVALVGKSGCGKSTIVSLIERFYDPTHGQITYDGKDLKSLNPHWYHQHISIVSQEPILFSGTIRDNLVYGLREDQYDDAQIEKVCKSANAFEFISDKDQFPKGYDTVVGERGVKLSGGQK